MRILFLTLVLVITGCKKKETSNSSTSTDPVAESIESALNSVSGASDDASNESVIASVKNKWNISELLFPSAWAASCSRSLQNSGGGLCVRNVNCEVGPYNWSGSVQLDFANGSTCSFSGVGDYFVREVEFTRSGPRGSLFTTSNSRTNYEGNSISGGIRIEKTLGGFEMDILGQSKVLTSNRIGTVFDVSVVTPVPLEMNQLARNGRRISSGTLDIYHNRAQFKASHTFNNVEWSANCCYPTSGSISVTLSGSRTASGTVTFNGCGNVTTTFENTKSFELSNCE